MKALVKKTMMACSIAAATLIAGAATAAPFNSFTVDPVGPLGPFQADKILGNYTEIATFNPNGTFDVSVYFSASGFAADNGTVPLDGRETGLGNTYGLYALYKASGTVNTSGPVTTFTFVPSSRDSLTWFLDEGAVTKVSARPTAGTGDFTFTGAGDDVLIATGTPISGQGTLDPTLSTCGSDGINCGSFGSKTTFVLDLANGQTFFTAPNPFYNISFQSGQLDNFTPSGTQTITGSLDVTFTNAAVPEPASLGLLGLGMLGLGFARRRKQ